MGNIRCLISGIQEVVLSDIVHRIAEDIPGIDIVNHIDGDKNIHQLIQSHKADLVVLGLESSCLATEHLDMLDEFPGLIIVGIVGSGRRAMVIVDDVGPNELTELMSLSIKKF